MKFEYSKYILRPLTLAGGLKTAHDQEGALLRVSWPDGKMGYSDLMPRSELGDPTIDQELDNLRNFKMSTMAEQAIALAKNDAEIRAEKRNAFKGARKVKNCFFIADPLNNTGSSLLQQIRTQNYTSVKIDCGQDFEKEADVVKRVLKFSGLMVRLDFNGKGDLSIFDKFMKSIDTTLRARIEFVEDPMPFEPGAWKEAAKLAPLAVEGQYHLVPWDEPQKMPPIKYLLIRPSRMDVNLALKRALQHKCKVVVTSSLEHPVSVAHASHIASNLIAQNSAILSDHDCLYQTYYAPHAFSGTLRYEGPYLMTTDGYGIGFDLKFRAIPWTALK